MPYIGAYPSKRAQNHEWIPDVGSIQHSSVTLSTLSFPKFLLALLIRRSFFENATFSRDKLDTFIPVAMVIPWARSPQSQS
jgi:hypothetical protein